MNGASLAFLGALFAGMAAMAAGQASGRPTVSVVGSIAAVVAFSCCAPLSERWRVSREQFGDAAYFLGFLFTLLGLSSTLWSIQSRSGLDITDVMPQFALALGTTIAGLVARMLISGFSPNQEQAIDHAEATLARASYQLATQMDILANQMTRHVATTDEVIRTLQARAGEALEGHVRALAPIPARVEEAMAAAVSAAAEGVRRALVPVEESGARAAAALQASVENVAEAAATVTSAATEPIAEAAADVARQLTAVARSIEAIRLPDAAPLAARVESDLGALAAATGRVKDGAEQMPAAMAAIVDAMTSCSERIRQVASEVRGLGGSLAEGMASLDATTQSLTESAVAARTATAPLAEAGSTIGAGAAALRAEIARMLAAAGTSAAGATEVGTAQRALLADMQLSVGALEELARELRTAIARLREVR